MKIILLLTLVALASCQPNFNNISCDSVPQQFVLQNRLDMNFLDNVTRSSFCGNEFSAYGTCCDPNTLQQDAIILNGSIYDSIDSLNYEYASFSDAMASVGNILNKLANSTQSASDTLYNARIAAAKGILNSQAWLFLSTSFSNSTQQINNFGSALSKCWPQVATARSSFLCTLCSGRSPAFTYSQSAGTFQVVISDSDCQTTSNNCVDSLNNIRTFVQGVSLYLNDVAPLLLSALNIFTDSQKVDPIALAKINNLVAEPDLDTSITGARSQIPVNQGVVCFFILSAGKPTLIEALSTVFEPNSSYDIYDLNGPISPQIGSLDAATDTLQNNLASGLETGTPAVVVAAPTSINTTVQNALSAQSNSFNFQTGNRRRRLQVIGNYLNDQTLQTYRGELRVTTAGLVGDSQTLTQTPIDTQADVDSGNVVDEYAGSQLGVFTQSLYALFTDGAITQNYYNPPTDNPPSYNPGVQDPVMLSPVNLNIPSA